MAIAFKCECDECGILMDDSSIVCDSCWNSLCKELDELRSENYHLSNQVRDYEKTITDLEKRINELGG